MKPDAVNPKAFGLPPRTRLERTSDTTLAIVIDRKSRIIMADGRKVLEKAAQIKTVSPPTKVILKTTAPICSKTRVYLETEGIEVMEI